MAAKEPEALVPTREESGSYTRETFRLLASHPGSAGLTFAFRVVPESTERRVPKFNLPSILRTFNPTPRANTLPPTAAPAKRGVSLILMSPFGKIFPLTVP